MENQFYTILTDIGIAKMANSMALGQDVSFTKFAVGSGENDANYNPISSQTNLKHEVYRANINEISLDQENLDWVIFEMVLPANTGGWTIREIGLFDDENNLLAIAKTPPTFKPEISSGAVGDTYFKVILEISNSENIQLKIDPAIILASQEFVTNKLKSHKDDLNPHPNLTTPNATTTISGKIEIATENEVAAATDNTRAITPKTLKVGFDNFKNTMESPIPAGSVISFAAATVPDGFLECNGASLSKTVYAKLFAAIGVIYGEDGDNFKLPDYRGEFLRGWDNGRGLDIDRIFGSSQEDLFKIHDHDGSYTVGGRGEVTSTIATAGTNNVHPSYKRKTYIMPEGGTETRPKNIATLIVIKY